MGEEIVQQLGGRAVGAVVVAVGGGGLISGIGAAIKSALPGVRAIGASPAKDAARRLGPGGKVVQVDALPTISDGTAGGVKEGSIHCRCAQNSSMRGFSSPSRKSAPRSGS